MCEMILDPTLRLDEGTFQVDYWCEVNPLYSLAILRGEKQEKRNTVASLLSDY